MKVSIFCDRPNIAERNFSYSWAYVFSCFFVFLWIRKETNNHMQVIPIMSTILNDKKYY